MEQHIESLVMEYKQKIKDCDISIGAEKARKKDAVAGGRIEDVIACLRSLELDIVYAKRQAYVQAIVDFESLLDYVEK